MIPRSPSGKEPAEQGSPEASGRPPRPDGVLGRVEGSKTGPGVLRGSGIHTSSKGFRGSEGMLSDTAGAEPRAINRLTLRNEVGAALERQLLLAGEPEEAPRPRPSGVPKALRRVFPWVLLVACASSGVFFFVQARKTWEGRVSSLQDKIAQIKQDSAAREDGLRRESAVKDREIAERKAEGQRIAALAEETLGQLRSALEDFRRLREEKLKLDEEYRQVLREQRSPAAHFFNQWLPEWVKRNAAEGTGGMERTETREGTETLGGAQTPEGTTRPEISTGTQRTEDAANAEDKARQRPQD